MIKKEFVNLFYKFYNDFLFDYLIHVSSIQNIYLLVVSDIITNFRRILKISLYLNQTETASKIVNIMKYFF